jgi:bacteriocin-like protein
MTTNQSQPGAPDSLVKASSEGAVELTEQELSQVSGGDGKTKAPPPAPKTDKEPYLVVTLDQALISSY